MTYRDQPIEDRVAKLEGRAKEIEDRLESGTELFKQHAGCIRALQSGLAHSRARDWIWGLLLLAVVVGLIVAAVFGIQSCDAAATRTHRDRQAACGRLCHQGGGAHLYTGVDQYGYVLCVCSWNGQPTRFINWDREPTKSP